MINFDEFYLHDHYGIKDVHVDNNIIYFSIIGKKKNDCYDLKIFSKNINYEFLNFKLFYETIDCVDKKIIMSIMDIKALVVVLLKLMTQFYFQLGILEIDL